MTAPTPSAPNSSATPSAPAGPAPRRLLGGYGPLVGFTAVIAALSVFVPTVRQEVVTKEVAASESVANSGDGSSDPGATGDTTTPDGTAATGDPGVTTDTAAGAGSGTGTGSSGSGSSGSSGSGAKRGATATTAKPGTAGAKSSGGVQPCADRQAQDPNDPYSPPCYAPFTGDNLGATSPGVTKDTITIAVRSQTFSTGFADALSVLAGAKFPKENQSVINDTLQALTDYFNSTYNFYGRKLKLVVYDGKGKLTEEIVSAGQEAAQADALKVATEIKAFADIGAVTPPYADALAKRKIVNIGAPYVSQKWLTDNKPYSWSVQTDCTRVVKSVAAYFLNKMANKPAAFAGGALKNQPRKVAVLAPDNSWYQDCVNDGLALLDKSGYPSSSVLRNAYHLDLNDITPQAVSQLQKLMSNNITTVLCGCDPIFLAALTKKAAIQNYHPEWLETGVALTDTDLVGQLLDQSVWDRAFGVSFLGPSENIQQSFAYRAYKKMRPAGTPSQAVQLIFPQLQLLAIGIQMAGPQLDPDRFQSGLFAYPRKTGPLGSWDFDASSYTPSQDAREIWYDRNARSAQTGSAGAWIESNPGKRFPIGQFPAGDPKVG